MADGLFFGRFFSHSRNCFDMLSRHNLFEFGVALMYTKEFSGSCKTETRPFPCSMPCLICLLSLMRGQSCDVTINTCLVLFRLSQRSLTSFLRQAQKAGFSCIAETRPVSCSFNCLLVGQSGCAN